MTDTQATPETMAEKLARLGPIIADMTTLPPDEQRRRMLALDPDDLEFLAEISIVAKYFRKGK